MENQLQRCWDRGELKRAKTVIDNDSDNGWNTANVARTLPGPRNLELYAKHVHAYLYSRTTYYYHPFTEEVTGHFQHAGKCEQRM